jgi:hypothetical protein
MAKKKRDTEEVKASKKETFSKKEIVENFLKAFEEKNADMIKESYEEMNKRAKKCVWFYDCKKPSLAVYFNLKYGFDYIGTRISL